MKTKFFSFALLFFITHLSFAQKDTCKIGVYVNCIYDFNLAEKSYMADFWMWMNYTNDSLHFENNLDIPNSKNYDFTHFSHQKLKGINWATQKCKTQLIHQWDVSNYPFDKQKLTIVIEETEKDTTELIYKADTKNSKLDPCFTTAEWNIESFKVAEKIRTYATTYGNPILEGNSSYSQIQAEININRNHSWLLLLKMLTGAYVAFMISCMVFFVSSENQDSRFGLCVGGLFAAIGNKYITESVVPSSNAYSLIDKVHHLTFGFILIIIVICIFSLRLYQSEDGEKKNKSFRIDKISFWIVLITFIVTNIILVMLALQK